MFFLLAFLIYMKLLLYNPLSASTALRLEELSLEFASIDLAAIVGTGRPAGRYEPCVRQRTAHHTALHWGYGRAAGVNKSAGLALLIGGFLSPSCIADVFSPPPSLQGRAGAARLRAGEVDIKTIKSNDKQLHLLLRLMLKMILNSHQRLRDVEGALFDIFLVATDSAIMVAMRAAGRGYHESVTEAKAAGTEHNLGPPFPHIWMAFLEVLRGADIGAANKQAVGTIYESHNNGSMDLVLQQVRLFKQAPCYDSNFRKIVMCVPEHRVVIGDLLKQLGEKAKVGRAPASGMERELSDWLQGFVED